MSKTTPAPVPPLLLALDLSVSTFADDEIWRPRFAHIDYEGLDPALQIDPAAIVRVDEDFRLELRLTLPEGKPFVFVPADPEQPAAGVALESVDGTLLLPEVVRAEWVDFSKSRKDVWLVVEAADPATTLPAVSAVRLPCVLENGQSFQEFYGGDERKAAYAEVQGGLYLALTNPAGGEESASLCAPDASGSPSEGGFDVVGFDDVCNFPQWDRFKLDHVGCDVEVEPSFRLSSGHSCSFEIGLPEGLQYQVCETENGYQAKVQVLGAEAPVALPAELQCAAVEDPRQARCRLSWRRGDERPSQVGRVVAFQLPVYRQDRPFDLAGVIDPTVIEPPPCSPRACTS